MSFTSIPVAGQPLRASVLAALITELRPLSALQSGDSAAKSANTTLSDLTGFAISVTAGAVYRFRLFLRYNSATAADLKLGWTFPTGLTMAYGADQIAAAGTAYTWGNFNQTSNPTFEGAGTGTTRVAYLAGSITVSSTSGVLQLQYAQNTSDASNTVVKDGTELIAWRTS